MAEIDNLTIEISASSATATHNIDRLEKSLQRLKDTTKGGAGLNSWSRQIEKIMAAAEKAVPAAQALAKIRESLTGLNDIQKASGLNSTLNTLKKLPEITKNLESIDLSRFAEQMNSVAVAVRPLAAEMAKVSAGFSAFPSKIQKVVQNYNTMQTANTRVGKSFRLLNIGALAFAFTRLSGAIKGWVEESTSYTENLNLFNASMGEYAQSAKEYAELVGEAIGIDPSVWMRNQGVFMTMATGFGVVSDKAALMSKNLTQLGYDLSSFFNISVDEAMQKLQSGISGELEPLRRLGYDLSQARLEAIAFANGIDKSVSSMTQAEKAQLRYYAIMTQVTRVQGDMARTLESPANQIRIFQAQIQQTARALGNIFIPMLNAVLPYLIAFTQIVREAANALASLFGFSLPEVDYSGLDNITTGAEDAEIALGGAAGAAEELKGSLAGFDEITLLTQTETGGGGGGAGAGFGGDLGLELPEYDFLGDAVTKKISDIIEKIKPILADLLQTAIEIGAAIATWKIGSSIIRGVRNLVDLFEKGKTELDGWQKAERVLQGAILIAIGAKWSYDAGYEIGKGKAQITDFIKAVLGPVASGVGGALIGSVIPGIGTAVGFTIGLVVGVLFELKGYLDGKEAAAVVSTFTQSLTDGGVSVEQYAKTVSSMFDQMAAGFTKYSEFAATMAQQDAIIETSTGTISTYMGTWMATGTASVKEIGKIIDALGNLATASQEKLSVAAETLKTTLVSALHDATGEAQENYESMLNIVYLLESNGNVALANMKAELNQLEMEFSQLDETSLTYAEDSARILDKVVEITSKMYGFGDKTGGATDALRNLNENMRHLDFSKIIDDPERASIVLGELEEATISAYEGVTTTYQANIDSLDALVQWVDTNSAHWQAAYQEALTIDPSLAVGDVEGVKKALRGQIDSIYREQVGEIDALYSESYGLLANSITNALNAAAAETYRAEIATQSKDWWANQLYGEDYAALEGIYGEEAVSRVDEAIREAEYRAIEKAAQHLAKDDTMSPILTALESTFSKTETVRAIALEAGADLGRGIIEGVDEGLTNQTAKALAQSGFDDLAAVVEECYKSSFQINSPSKIMNPAGEGLVEGIAQGMTDTASATTLEKAFQEIRRLLVDVSDVFYDAMRDAGTNMMNAMEKAIQSARPRIRSSLENLFTGVNIKVPHFSVRGSFSVDPPQVPEFDISWYAQGGFPEHGQMFIAREAGPELVGSIGGRTAVANNDQIVEGIAAGVASANAEQNSMLRQQNALLQQQNEILMELLHGGLSLGEPNASFGRFASRSMERYAAVNGR